MPAKPKRAPKKRFGVIKCHRARIAETFVVTETEMAELRKQLHRHKKSCPTARTSQQSFTYMFKPTGIGTAVSVRCNCGEEMDITDYMSW